MSATGRSASAGLARPQLREPRAQLVDLFVAAQAGQGGAQLVAAALQFAAMLIGGPSDSEVSHPTGG